jgi:hypothetical protein
MYFVGNKSFEKMSDAMACCSSGSSDAVVTDEDGIVLMRHEEVPIDDIYGLMVAQTFLKVQCLNGFSES